MPRKLFGEGDSPGYTKDMRAQAKREGGARGGMLVIRGFGGIGCPPEKEIGINSPQISIR